MGRIPVVLAALSSQALAIPSAASRKVAIILAPSPQEVTVPSTASREGPCAAISMRRDSAPGGRSRVTGITLASPVRWTS